MVHPGGPISNPIVRMSGPKVLKARYRRDDCLQCDAVAYWAATVAAPSVERVSGAAGSPSMMLGADRNRWRVDWVRSVHVFFFGEQEEPVVGKRIGESVP